MDITLRKMTRKEYKKFIKYSKKSHAEELMQQLGFSLRKARSETRLEIRKMLPRGIKTKNNLLMVIEDICGKKDVGFMWYMYETVDGVKQCFLCDFFISEAERRKGYASGALAQMETDAAINACSECVLFVNNDNAPAVKLYRNCGYVLLRESGYGMFMKKTL